MERNNLYGQKSLVSKLRKITKQNGGQVVFSELTKAYFIMLDSFSSISKPSYTKKFPRMLTIYLRYRYFQSYSDLLRAVHI